MSRVENQTVHSFKLALQSLNIFECELSTCQLLIYPHKQLVFTRKEAQRKATPHNAIACTNILHLDSFFISKFHFLVSPNVRQNTQDRTNSYSSRRISDTFKHERCFAWHVILIQISKRSCDCKKGEHDAGKI